MSDPVNTKETAVEPAPDAVTPTPATAAAAKPASKKPAAKRSSASKTRVPSKHEIAFAEAVRVAEAVKIDPVAVPAKPGKPAKPKEAAKVTKEVKTAKTKKPKLVRDSFTIPENEYAQFAALKKRLLDQSVAAKKSEILRAGLALLAAQSDVDLVAQLKKVTPIKTGRPAK